MDRTLIAAPAAGIVSVQEAKEHLRVTYPDEDNLIGRLIMAATESVEDMTRRAYVTRTYRLDLPEFCIEIFLPSVPLNSITSVEYYDEDNANQSVASSNYRSSNSNALLYFDSDYSFPGVYDRHDAVRVTYVSGYSADDIPAEAKAACLLIVGDLYENREAQMVGLSMSPNDATRRLLMGLKVPRL